MNEEKSENKTSNYEQFVDRIIRIMFSREKTTLYLILIFLFGFILRFIGAINLGVSADDMHFSVHAINFLNSGKLVVYDQSASLWYYVTDIFYNIFGIGQLTSRISALLFGSFSIIIIFFLTKEFFGKKVGLIASFLLSISPFHIKYTISEMDNMAMFFVLFGMLNFIWALKENKNKFFIFSGALLGLGILTKVYTLMFIPMLIFYSLYYQKSNGRKVFDKMFIKKLFIFILFAGIFAIPSLTHNYLLYKDRGITDLIYTNALGIGKEKATQFYSWDSGFGHGADWLGFIGLKKSIHTGDEKLPSSVYPFKFIWKNDPIVLIAGLFGILILIIRKKREYPFLFAFMIIFVFSYLAARILLAKHYIFLLLFLIIPASYLISGLDETIRKKIKNFRMRYLLIVLLIFSLFLIGIKTDFAPAPFYAESEVGQLMSFKDKYISENSFVVADSRIYRGQIHWMLNGREYIEANLLADVLNVSGATGRAVLTEVYYIECVVDDCGWGTVASQPDFNNSMEQITSFFKENGKVVKEIQSTSFAKKIYPISRENSNIHFRVYKMSLPIDHSIYPNLKQSKVWFLYPIGYDYSIAEPFDKYEIYNNFDELLNNTAKLIIYIAIFLSFISLFFALYIIIKES